MGEFLLGLAFSLSVNFPRTPYRKFRVFCYSSNTFRNPNEIVLSGRKSTSEGSHRPAYISWHDPWVRHSTSCLTLLVGKKVPSYWKGSQPPRRPQWISSPDSQALVESPPTLDRLACVTKRLLQKWQVWLLMLGHKRPWNFNLAMSRITCYGGSQTSCQKDIQAALMRRSI